MNAESDLKDGIREAELISNVVTDSISNDPEFLVMMDNRNGRAINARDFLPLPTVQEAFVFICKYGNTVTADRMTLMRAMFVRELCSMCVRQEVCPVFRIHRMAAPDILVIGCGGFIEAMRMRAILWP